MATLVVGQTGRYVGEATVGSPDPPNLFVGRPIVSAPQLLAAREYAGCAVVFGAVAALLVATQPSPIGAAEYNVGSQQSALANSQDRSWVRGTNPALIPVIAPVVVTPHSAAPEQVDSGYAVLFGPTPPTASAVIRGARVAAPEQVDSGYADFARYAYPSVAAVDAPPPRTRIAAPEQIDTAAAWVWWTHGIAPPDPVGGVSYTVGTHRDAYAAQDGYAVKFGRFVTPAVQGTDVEVGETLVAAPEQVDSGYAQRFGRRVVGAVAGADTRVSRFHIAAPEQVDSGYARLSRYPPLELWVVTRYYEAGQDDPTQPGSAIWGFTPTAVAGTDRPPPTTKIAAPAQLESGFTWRARFVYPFVAGSDPIIGSTRTAAPPQIDSGSALTWGPQPTSASAVIPKTRWAAPEQINSGDGWTWGPFVVAQLDTPIFKPIIAAPPHIQSGEASVWGLFRVFVPGTDVRVGRFLVAAPPQIESGEAVRFSFKQYLAGAIINAGRRIIAGALGRRGKASRDRLVQAKRRNRKIDGE